MPSLALATLWPLPVRMIRIDSRTAGTSSMTNMLAIVYLSSATEHEIGP
jgi:hypothetical protein